MNLTNNYKLTVEQINAKNRAIVANIVIALLIVGSVSILLITWLILNRRNKIILLKHKREINSIVADITRQQLIQNETLTCILSALNISVKQIADIQGRSQDAVYKQKYRLKEKLPLDVYELFFPKGNL